MFRQSSNTAAFFSVLIAALIFLLCLAGVAAAQVNNTSLGTAALQNNTAGSFNTASGFVALFGNTIGDNNTAIGNGANVSGTNLTNATAIGNGAIVNNSNKIRLGNTQVTVLESQVGLTVVSDKTQKENFQPVDGEEVPAKIRGFELTSWNFID